MHYRKVLSQARKYLKRRATEKKHTGGMMLFGCRVYTRPGWSK